MKDSFISFEDGTPVNKQRSKYPYSFDTYSHEGIPLTEIQGKYEVVYHDHLKHPSASKVRAVSIPMAQHILKEEFGEEVSVLSIGIECHVMHGHAINIFAYQKNQHS